MLVDIEIKTLAESGLLENYVSQNIKSIGYDLRTKDFYDLDKNHMFECSLLPNETIFIGCIENINLPADIAARIILRNSRIRQGLQIEAPIYYPGHKTQVYFRVTNISKSMINLTLKDEIASITFEKLGKKPHDTYSGTFQEEITFKGMADYSEKLEAGMKSMPDNIFVLMPFREEWSDAMHKQIKTVGKILKIKIYRADEVYGIRPVINDIVKSIQNATIVISVMTGGNRNVNYELGLAHAWKKPSIMIANSKDDIPFDYQHLRVIYYNEKNPNWGKDLVSSIINTVKTIKQEGFLEFNYFR